MRLCDKHIPAEMSIGTFRQKCTNQLSHFAPRNVTIHCYICVRNVTIGHFCTEYDCHITPQNFDFWIKFWSLNKISIFEKNFDFWPKFQFLDKISIFDQNIHFWPTFRFLTTISIFDQMCSEAFQFKSFLSNFRFLTYF